MAEALWIDLVLPDQPQSQGLAVKAQWSVLRCHLSLGVVTPEGRASGGNPLPWQVLEFPFSNFLRDQVLSVNTNPQLSHLG